VISVTNATIGVAGGDSTPADQKGQPNGYDLSGTPGLTLGSAPNYTTLGDYSSPSTYLVQLGSPTFILTYGESELLLADAAQRFGVGGSAATHYNNGVVAAITYLSEYDSAAAIPAGTAAAYVAA